MKLGARLLPVLSLMLLAVLLAGCSSTKSGGSFFKPSPNRKTPAQVGTYKVGNPYRVGSVWYYPEENFQYAETGIASWYGPDFHGGRTANGEMYDQNEMTAAHRTLQMPSYVRVTNLDNGRAVVVRINDRGPYLRGRVIDVSKRAADLLGFIGKGTARVKIEVLGKESRQVAEAARRGMNTSRLTFADLDREFIEPAQATAAAAADGLPAPVSGVQLAAVENESLPESLKTPTITVEELNKPGAISHSTDAPKWSQVDATAPNRNARPEVEPFPTHLNKGRAMPDAVVTQMPVNPTGIFVQAGAFGVRGNAEALQKKLSAIAPAHIEPAAVGGRTLYRVKLGPMASVAAADKALEKVLRAGGDGARVVKSK